MPGEPVDPVSDPALGTIEREVTVLVRRTLEQVWSDDYGDVVDRYTYPLLVVLELQGRQRLAQLAQRLGLSKPTISRQVTRLTGAGLVSVHDDPADARSGLIDLTTAGRSEISAVRARRRVPLRAALEHWPADDRALLARLLTRFNTDLDARP